MSTPVIASKTIIHKADGINTVIAEAGQPIPLQYLDLVDAADIAGDEPATSPVLDELAAERDAAHEQVASLTARVDELEAANADLQQQLDELAAQEPPADDAADPKTTTKKATGK